MQINYTILGGTVNAVDSSIQCGLRTRIAQQTPRMYDVPVGFDSPRSDKKNG